MPPTPTNVNVSFQDKHLINVSARTCFLVVSYHSSSPSLVKGPHKQTIHSRVNVSASSHVQPSTCPHPPLPHSSLSSPFKFSPSIRIPLFSPKTLIEMHLFPTLTLLRLHLYPTCVPPIKIHLSLFPFSNRPNTILIGPTPLFHSWPLHYEP